MFSAVNADVLLCNVFIFLDSYEEWILINNKNLYVTRETFNYFTTMIWNPVAFNDV